MIKDEKIAVLGSGITAKAVKEKLTELDIEIVSIEAATLVIASPGIAPKDYPKTTAPIISEIDLAHLLLTESDTRPTIIAITGSNGKTTVTAMLAHILSAKAGGNIGVPYISHVNTPFPNNCLVLELSSYQLEQSRHFQADIAIMLNITPDHLDRHGDIQTYANEKAKITLNQRADQHLIYNQDDPMLCEIAKQSPATKHPVSFNKQPDTFPVLPIKGPHNIMNALMAHQAAKLIGLTQANIFQKLQSFPGVEHRIEALGQINGVAIYNDSKATNPEATEVAIAAFDTPIHLILCGFDKGLTLTSLLKRCDNTPHVKSIITYGAIADRIITENQALNPQKPIQKATSLSDAITQLLNKAQPGDSIVFSPASSSFDLYDNFEARGNAFKDHIKALQNENS